MSAAAGPGGRTGVSASPHEPRHLARREFPPLDLRKRDDPAVQELVAGLFGEAAGYVELMRRLGATWEDDPEIREAATGRLIAQAADVGYVTPRDADHARAIVTEIRAAQVAAGRAQDTIHVLADLVVFLGELEQAASSRKDRLDELAGEPYASDAAVFTGTAGQLADLVQQWQQTGLTGFRLRPGAIPGDLEAISRALVPELQRRGAFRSAYEPGSLRGRLGLPPPAPPHNAPSSRGDRARPNHSSKATSAAHS